MGDLSPPGHSLTRSVTLSYPDTLSYATFALYTTQGAANALGSTLWLWLGRRESWDSATCPWPGTTRWQGQGAQRLGSPQIPVCPRCWQSQGLRTGLSTSVPIVPGLPPRLGVTRFS